MQGQATIVAYRRPLGYQQISAATLAASTGFTLPATIAGLPVAYAVVQCNGGNVRWRDDGTAPTSSVGMTLPAGSELDYSGEMGAIRFILSTGAPILDVMYYA